MSRVAVVHLIRKANGLEPFRRFFQSYRLHESGAAHDLLLVFKGFDAPTEIADYEALLGPLPYHKLFVPDIGYDIGSYFRVLQASYHDCYCFLNSFSIIQAANWLSLLEACLRRDGVGLVGATGSYESTYGNLLRELRLPAVSLRARLRQLCLRLPRYWASYPSFPNPSVRTNAFMVRREVLAHLRPRRMRTKSDALRFESGHNSLTRRVAARGLATLVVGRDGRGYAPREWPASNTFRQLDQPNLLIADNQTLRYAQAGAAERRMLSEMAWGSQARPR
jgi:hypothetical protein